MSRAPSDLKLRQLQYFLAAAEHLHFTHAADKLSITQPTLSHQIAELEGHLGTQLFDRIGRSVRLTEAGELLRPFVMRSLRQLEEGRIALEQLSGLMRGKLRIGVIQSFGRLLLPPVLGMFMSKYPAVHIEALEMTASDIERALTAGLLDLGIAFAPAQHEETEVEPILEEEMLLMVGFEHPLARQEYVSMRQLDGVRLALLSIEFSTRALIEGYLRQAEAKPDIVLETNSMEFMLGAARSHHLATIVSQSAIGPEAKEGLRALPMRDPVPVRVSAMLWPRYSFRTEAALRFAEMMRSSFMKTGGATIKYR